MTDSRLRFLANRRVRRWLIALSVGAVFWLFCSLAVAYALTHRRGARSDEPVPSIADLKIETHRLKTRDGEELGAWFIEGRADEIGRAHV